MGMSCAWGNKLRSCLTGETFTYNPTMSKLKHNPEKERILRNIIAALDRTQALCHTKGRIETVVGLRGDVYLDTFDTSKPAAQFTYLGGVQLQKNSIVKCMTNPNHDWGIARYIGGSGSDYQPYDPWILRELGSKRELRMHNEMLQPLIGVPWHELAEGWQYKMYRWSRMALWNQYNKTIDDYQARFRGSRLTDDDTILEIKTCVHIWGDSIYIDDKWYQHHHRVFRVPINTDTRLKDIVQFLNDNDVDAKWTDDELDMESGS